VDEDKNEHSVHNREIDFSIHEPYFDFDVVVVAFLIELVDDFLNEFDEHVVVDHFD